MIYVDRRDGSSELIGPLKSAGLPVDDRGPVTLDSADIAFEGRGERGKIVQVGIEFKRLEELVASMRSARLQGYQLPKMREQYDYAYLLIEGELSYNRQGWLTSSRGRMGELMPGMMAVSEFLKRLHTLHLCGGINPVWAANRKDTVQQISALYHTWNDCDLDDHKSHLEIYVAPQLSLVSGMQKALQAFPHVSRKTGLAIKRRFGSLRKAVVAKPEEWAEVTTTDSNNKKRRLGLKAAADIQRFLDEEN